MQRDKTDCNRYLQDILLLVALYTLEFVFIWLNGLMIFRNIYRPLKRTFLLVTAWGSVQFCTQKKGLYGFSYEEEYIDSLLWAGG